MKLLHYGNCQTEVVMRALAIHNPEVQFQYAGNSVRVAYFDPERTERLFDWCDHIVTQPVMNTANADHHEVLRERFAGKISFMPYVWIDGLFSLCSTPGGRAYRDDSGLIGQDFVLAHLRQTSLAETLRDFEEGRLDFQHRKRFDESIAELARRETHADVRVSDVIAERYRAEAVMLTHNHPHPAVVNEIAGQIARRLGLCYVPIGAKDVGSYAAITLPEFAKVLSPHTVRDLGLCYGHDPHWLRTGKEFIMTIADYLLQYNEKLDRALAAKEAIREQRRAERRAERVAERRRGQ